MPARVQLSSSSERWMEEPRTGGGSFEETPGQEEGRAGGRGSEIATLSPLTLQQTTRSNLSLCHSDTLSLSCESARGRLETRLSTLQLPIYHHSLLLPLSNQSLAMPSLALSSPRARPNLPLSSAPCVLETLALTFVSTVLVYPSLVLSDPPPADLPQLLRFAERPALPSRLSLERGLPGARAICSMSVVGKPSDQELLKRSKKVLADSASPISLLSASCLSQ